MSIQHASLPPALLTTEEHASSTPAARRILSRLAQAPGRCVEAGRNTLADLGGIGIALLALYPVALVLTVTAGILFYAGQGPL